MMRRKLNLQSIFTAFAVCWLIGMPGSANADAGSNIMEANTLTQTCIVGPTCILTQYPILPCSNIGIVNNVTSTVGFGCKDDRYKNIAIIGPQPVAYYDLGYAKELTKAGANGEQAIEDAIDFGGTGISPGTQGSMPNKNDYPNGMPHKDTPAISLVDKFPWLYKQTTLSQKILYRGVGGNTYSVINNPLAWDALYASDDMVNNVSNNPSAVQMGYLDPNTHCKTPTLASGCSTGGGNTGDTSEYWARLVMDACTNQYILPMGLTPTYVFNPTYRNHGLPYDESYCQPLATMPVPCKFDLADTQGESAADAHAGKNCLTDNGEAIDTVSSAVMTGTQTTGVNFTNKNMILSASGGVGSNSLGMHNKYDYRAWAYLERAWKDVLASNYSPSNNGKPNLLIVGSSTGKIVPPLDTSFQYFTNYGEDTGVTGSAYPDWATTATSNIPPGENTTTGNIAIPGGSGNYQSKWKSWADTDTFKGALTTINQLAIRPYERIFDSTHPFTPRWDMTGDTDRGKYSPMAIFPAGGTLPVIPYKGYEFAIPGVTSSCAVRCAAIPVDILTFRGAEFNACMTCRITANTNCFWDEVIFNNMTLASIAGDSLSLSDAVTNALSAKSQNYTRPILIELLPGAPIPPGLILYWAKPHLLDYECITTLANSKYTGGPQPYANYLPETKWPANQWPPCAVTYEYPYDNLPGKMPYSPTLYDGDDFFKSIVNDLLAQIDDTTIIIPIHKRCSDCLKAANDYASNASQTRRADSKYIGSSVNYRLSSVTKCCNDLAQPVAPINMLKIRNLQDDPSLKAQTDTGLTQNNGLNVPEGYRFRDYFTNPSDNLVHMPFMRWWDTGTAAGGPSGENVSATNAQGSAISNGLNLTSSLPYAVNSTSVNMAWYDPLLGTNYDPNCDKGKDDIIVGVGTESTGSGSPAGLCRYGGGGGAKGANAWQYQCVNVGNPDRLTSWLELKQYQINSVRFYGMNCLPMQEKMWKWMDTADGPLYYAGTVFDRQWHEPNDTTNTLTEKQTTPWPLRWRGFLTDSQQTVSGQTGTYPYRFPNFDTGTSSAAPPGGSTFTGLDNAQPGDIIYVYQDDAAATTGQIFPFMAIVLQAQHNAANACQNNITVADINNGKYPDVCGHTDYIGMGQPRQIFKEWLPENVQNALFPGGTETDSCGDSYTVPGTATTTTTLTAAGYCSDPKYAACTLNNKNPPNNGTAVNYWDQIHVYRPSLDERPDKNAGSR